MRLMMGRETTLDVLAKWPVFVQSQDGQAMDRNAEGFAGKAYAEASS